MEKTFKDDVGRMFCLRHKRDLCHECGFDFRMPNEQAAGLRQKPSELDEAAKIWAAACASVRGMEYMSPRPSEAIFEQNRQYMKEYDRKMQRYPPAEVKAAKKRALETHATSDVDRRALVQALAQKNPGQTHFDVGGAEMQAIYDTILKAPKTKAGRGDLYTCAYCGKTKVEKLLKCARCKTISYCSKACQVSHWRAAHKKECVIQDNEPKSLYLTWEQLEAHKGAVATGKTLEVRSVLDESIGLQQVMTAKDRVGNVRRIAAYTDSRTVPGLEVGKIMRWKNPRCWNFANGSSGLRIEQADLKNITIKK